MNESSSSCIEGEVRNLLFGVFLLALGCSSASSSFVATDGGDGGARDGDPVFSDGGEPSCKNVVLKWWSASKPGADGTWGTPDDDVSGLRDLRLDDRAAVGAIVWHSARGADGTWDTNDDVIDLANRYEWDKTALLRLWTSTSSGTDGAWGTVDDPPSNVATFTNDANGHLLEQKFLGAAGADGTWLTADDVQQGRTTYEFNSAGTEGVLRNYTAKGNDGAWGTSDDVIGAVIRPKGKTYRVADTVVYYNQPGKDGSWATPDDVIASVLVVDCAKAIIWRYSAPGPDATWQTADDVVGSYEWMTGRADCLVAACTAMTGPN